MSHWPYRRIRACTYECEIRNKILWEWRRKYRSVEMQVEANQSCMKLPSASLQQSWACQWCANIPEVEGIYKRQCDSRWLISQYRMFPWGSPEKKNTSVKVGYQAIVHWWGHEAHLWAAWLGTGWCVAWTGCAPGQCATNVDVYYEHGKTWHNIVIK